MTPTTDPAAVFAAAAEKLAAGTPGPLRIWKSIGIELADHSDLLGTFSIGEDATAFLLARNSAPAALDLGRASAEMGQVFARINGVWTGWDDDADEVVARFRAALDAFVAALAGETE